MQTLKAGSWMKFLEENRGWDTCVCVGGGDCVKLLLFNSELVLTGNG